MARHLSRYFLFVFVVIGVSGCSYWCHFEARGSIREAATGNPIPKAQIRLLDDQKHEFFKAVITDSLGAFVAAFHTSPFPGDELSGWKMIVAAEGFESETVEVGAVKQPRNGNDWVYLIFNVTLRKGR